MHSEPISIIQQVHHNKRNLQNTNTLQQILKQPITNVEEVVTCPFPAPHSELCAHSLVGVGTQKTAVTIPSQCG